MKKLESFYQKPFFTTREASENGISARMLSYYVEKGLIERISKGVYRSKNYEPDSKNLQWEDLAVAARNVSGGVICLVSALVFYELTDEMMREFWIAVDNKNSKAKFPMCRIVRMRNMDIGVKEIVMAGIKVKIFDMERTIIDSFRLLDYEIAMKALKIYLSGVKGKPNIKKLNQYTHELRSPKVREYIMAIIT